MLNIVISVNDKYIDAAESMLFSLRSHVDEPITVWFLNHSVNAEKNKRFGLYLKKRCNMDLVNIEVGSSFFDSMPLVFNELFSIEIYYRILIPWLLPNEVTRALWLDADIIIRGDISAFYHKDFQGHCIIACEDFIQINPDAKMTKRNHSLFGVGHRYFNSGVMLLNNERIRQQYTLEAVCRFSRLLKDELIYPDQDILNYLYRGKVLYEDCRVYNCGLWAVPEMSEEEFREVRILHYYGPRKPWNVWEGNDPGLDYWKVQRQRGRAVILPYLLHYGRKKLRKEAWLRKAYRSVKERIGQKNEPDEGKGSHG